MTVNKKDILPLLLRAALSLLAAILAGVVLLTAVYALPTARMRHNVSISLPYILSEGDRYQWAPYHNGTELDGFTDAIMLGNAIYGGSGSPLGDALVNPRMEFTPGDSVPVDSLSRYAQGAEDGRQVTYARYWHGYLVFLKPLLLFFTPSDIRLLNMTVQLILAAVLLALTATPFVWASRQSAAYRRYMDALNGSVLYAREHDGVWLERAGSRVHYPQLAGAGISEKLRQAGMGKRQQELPEGEGVTLDFGDGSLLRLWEVPIRGGYTPEETFGVFVAYTYPNGETYCYDTDNLGWDRVVDSLPSAG